MTMLKGIAHYVNDIVEASFITTGDMYCRAGHFIRSHPGVKYFSWVYGDDTGPGSDVILEFFHRNLIDTYPSYDNPGFFNAFFFLRGLRYLSTVYDAHRSEIEQRLSGSHHCQQPK